MRIINRRRANEVFDLFITRFLNWKKWKKADIEDVTNYLTPLERRLKNRWSRHIFSRNIAVLVRWLVGWRIYLDYVTVSIKAIRKFYTSKTFLEIGVQNQIHINDIQMKDYITFATWYDIECQMVYCQLSPRNFYQ